MSALLDSLLAQRKTCRGDQPHAARCRRCARGRATAVPIVRVAKK